MSTYSQLTTNEADEHARIVDELQPEKNDAESQSGRIFEKTVEPIEVGPDMEFTRESLIRNRFLIRAGRITDRQISQAVELLRKNPSVKQFLLSLLKKRRSLNHVRSGSSALTRRNREELDERLVQQRLLSMKQQTEEMAWNEAEHEIQEQHLEHLQFAEDLQRMIAFNRHFDTTLIDSIISHSEVTKSLIEDQQLINAAIEALPKTTSPIHGLQDP
ncbi:hypothetical protein AB1L42_01530 [Thalassoglobus sp. JC818]|uniref:hypothetical protein n=1 Tax=Thalassoglobus sp. JC818 TaxID=3232136 RepID=UPI0034590712